MQAQVINIGTSKGIRIPATVLKSLQQPQKFELTVNKRQIVLDIVDNKNPRAGWAKKFQAGNDLLINDSLDLDLLDEV
jgi:antitoxin MazE